MAIDWDKVDEVTMALLKLTSFTEHGLTASWKTHSWDVMNRLHEKGWIHDPVGKAKSVALTPEGLRQADALFEKHFGAVDSGK
jgi:Mn-dependent DtxR family transcriptional regulator